MRRPVRRSAKRVGNGKAQIAAAAARPARSSRPPCTGASPRRTVSTSGSSGMSDRPPRCYPALMARQRLFRYGRARLLRADEPPPMSDSASFGYRERPARRQAGAGRRRVPQRRAPLRPDERPDVGRPAPALEGRAGERAQPAAAAAGPGGSSTWPAAPATSPSASRSARSGHAEITVADINAAMLEVGRERAEKRGLAQHRLPRGERRGAALRRCELRRLHDRLRHPQRAAHRGGAGGGVSRAEARRPFPLPGILRGRHADARPHLRALFLPRRSRRSAASWPATRKPIATWSNRSAPSPTRSASPTWSAPPASRASTYRNFSGGIAALHSGWKL